MKRTLVILLMILAPLRSFSADFSALDEAYEGWNSRGLNGKEASDIIGIEQCTNFKDQLGKNNLYKSLETWVNDYLSVVERANTYFDSCSQLDKISNAQDVDLINSYFQSGVSFNKALELFDTDDVALNHALIEATTNVNTTPVGWNVSLDFQRTGCTNELLRMTSIIESHRRRLKTNSIHQTTSCSRHHQF